MGRRRVGGRHGDVVYEDPQHVPRHEATVLVADVRANCSKQIVEGANPFKGIRGAAGDGAPISVQKCGSAQPSSSLAKAVARVAVVDGIVAGAGEPRAAVRGGVADRARIETSPHSTVDQAATPSAASVIWSTFEPRIHATGPLSTGIWRVGDVGSAGVEPSEILVHFAPASVIAESTEAAFVLAACAPGGSTPARREGRTGERCASARRWNDEASKLLN